MKVRWFAIACSLVLLLGVQGLEVELAYANCCPCSCMPWMCTCAGKVDPVQGYCNYCLSPDPPFLTKAPIDSNTEQETNEGVFPYLARLDSIRVQQIAEMRVGTPCLRDKFFYGVLGDHRVLKFEALHLDKNVQSQTLAFHDKGR